MRQQPDKAWLITVELQARPSPLRVPGRRALMLDPRAQGITRNDRGERVSLVPVS